MNIRRITSVLVATVMAASAVAVGTVTFASEGHGDDSTTQTSQPASGASAPAGEPGTLEAPRDITVTMTDNLRFDPGTVVVGEGETIRFLLDNPTAAPHDFLIGDLEEQVHHHEEMAAGGGHDDDVEVEDVGGLPPAVTLQPGESMEVIATFDEAGDLMIGCHVPGHWEAGMRGDITVMPAGAFLLGVSQAPAA